MSAEHFLPSSATILASLPLLLPKVSPTPEQVEELSAALSTSLSALEGSKHLSVAVSAVGRANAVAACLENAVSYPA